MTNSIVWVLQSELDDVYVPIAVFVDLGTANAALKALQQNKDSMYRYLLEPAPFIVTLQDAPK